MGDMPDFRGKMVRKPDWGTTPSFWYYVCYVTMIIYQSELLFVLQNLIFVDCHVRVEGKYTYFPFRSISLPFYISCSLHLAPDLPNIFSYRYNRSSLPLLGLRCLICKLTRSFLHCFQRSTLEVISLIIQGTTVYDVLELVCDMISDRANVADFIEDFYLLVLQFHSISRFARFRAAKTYALAVYITCIS